MSVSNLLVLLLRGTTGQPIPEWSYDFTDETGPFYWSTLGFDECAGTKGSPINLIPTEALDGLTAFETELADAGITDSFLEAWDFNDEYIQHFEVSNGGSSITLTPVDSLGSYVNTKESGHIARLPNVFGTVNDDPESAYFCLASLHFHWGHYDSVGSEHTEEGVQYAAEVHFVHYRCDFDDLNAAIEGSASQADPYVLAVVGFWYELDDTASDFETSAMLAIQNHVERLEGVGDKLFVGNINLEGSLMPPIGSNSNLYHYAGGLTSPPCVEIVRWHMFDYKLKIRSDQLAALRTVNTTRNDKMTHNWRPVVQNEGELYRLEFGAAGPTPKPTERKSYRSYGDMYGWQRKPPMGPMGQMGWGRPVGQQNWWPF